MADSELQVRPAGEADRDFLIEAILEAEKSGSDRISYCGIFSLEEAELRSLLEAILDEDFLGQELCISDFLVGEFDGEPAGAACGWVEGAEGMPSTLIKANLLRHFFGAERMGSARPFLEKLPELTLEREAGAIQLESIYVRPAFRGRGVTGRILTQHLRRLGDATPEARKAQIVLMKDNAGAYRAYEKLGFQVARERSTEDPSLRAVLPGTTKILMEKVLSR